MEPAASSSHPGTGTRCGGAPSPDPERKPVRRDPGGPGGPGRPGATEAPAQRRGGQEHVLAGSRAVCLCPEGGSFWEQAGVSITPQGDQGSPSGCLMHAATSTVLASTAVTFRWSLPGENGLSRVPRLSLLVAERPAPPRELLVPQAEVTARSLRLQWVPGSDGASPIRYFTVQVRELPGGQWLTYSSSVSHGATACTVERYSAPGAQARNQGPAPRGPRPSASSRPRGRGLRRTPESVHLFFHRHPMYWGPRVSVYQGPTAPRPPQPLPRPVLQTGSAQLAGTPQAPGRRGRGDRDGRPGSVGSGVLTRKRQTLCGAELAWGGAWPGEGGPGLQMSSHMPPRGDVPSLCSLCGSARQTPSLPATH